MAMFEQDLILRAIEALGRAIAGIVMRERVGLQLPGRRDQQDIDEWLGSLPADALDSVNGRELADAAALRDIKDFVIAITQLNPSRRPLLSEPLRASRYALKAKLQNELLRRYPAHVSATVDRDNPALLHLRAGGSLELDAKHLPIAALDEDVREQLGL